MLIFLTAWVIVFPESELVFKVFNDVKEWAKGSRLEFNRRQEKWYNGRIEQL